MDTMQTDFYQAGGSLPSDAQSYVVRKADHELYSSLKEGQFCYVLTARQMGKSSLRVKTMKRLEQEGFACVAIDMTQIGSQNVSPDQWYNSLMSNLSRGLNLRQKYQAWKADMEGLTPVNRFSLFIETLILAEIKKPIVIFIDEIDSVLGLDPKQVSTDDFFAAIRSFYNARADLADFNRLNFALFGVAAPDDLMKDQMRTPFNIGEAIALENFTLDEARGTLLKGLQHIPGSEEKLLREVFRYTNGQPYLTQTICAHLVRLYYIDNEAQAVKKLVDELFLNKQSNELDHNLASINNRIMQDGIYNLQMLQLYQRLLYRERVPVNRTDATQIYLRLSGLVNEKDHHLQISNCIYQEYFDQEWLRQAFDKIERPFAKDLQRWLESNRSEAATLRGKVLTEAIEWKRGREDVSDLEQEFIEFSVNIEHNEQIKEARAEHALQLKFRNRVLRVLLGIVIIMFVAMAAQWIESESNREQLEVQKKRLEKRNRQVEIQAEQLQVQSDSLNKKSQALQRVQALQDTLRKEYESYSRTQQQHIQARDRQLAMRRLELEKLEVQLHNTEALNKEIEKNMGLLQLRENILQAERDNLAREKEVLEKEKTEYMQAQLNLNTIQLKTRLLEESMLVAGFSQDHSPFKLSLENPYKAKASVIRKIGIQFSVPELQSETATYHFVVQFINNDKPGKPQILLNEIAKNNVTKGKVSYEFPVQTPGKGIYILRVGDPQQPLVKTEYYFRLD